MKNKFLYFCVKIIDVLMTLAVLSAFFITFILKENNYIDIYNKSFNIVNSKTLGKIKKIITYYI